MKSTHSRKASGNGHSAPSGEQEKAPEWWLPPVEKTGAVRGSEEAEQGPVLITGGAGFIGTNLAHRFLSRKCPVVLFDNLCRPGVENNLRWLRDTHGELLRIEVGDMRDRHALGSFVRFVRPSSVFDFAAQVAVTRSLSDPIHDFEVNARGTLNLLEALRALDTPAPLIFTSTNKVYGQLEDVPLRSVEGRYEPVDTEQSRNGFSEARPLNFHSPYGCSKGAAEQYVLDYARTFGLPALVFRMSCIYGPHQFGNEDQGWVAHFLIRALDGEPITIFGDGRQVRDILFVEDLVDALLVAQQKVNVLRGQAFNIGGGPGQTVSLLELATLIGEILGEPPELIFEAWRPADQRFYVSDIRRFCAATEWAPRVGVREGVTRLYQWLLEFRAWRAKRARGSDASRGRVAPVAHEERLSLVSEPGPWSSKFPELPWGVGWAAAVLCERPQAGSERHAMAMGRKS